MKLPRVRLSVWRMMVVWSLTAVILTSGPVSPGQPPTTPGKQPPGGYLPSRFRLHIGGFFPPSYSVELRGGSLLYRARSLVPGTETVRETGKVITPTAAQWQHFWAAMAAVDLWRWRPRYDAPEVMDGTQWGLDVTLSGRRIESSGSNSFPGAPSRPPGPPIPGPVSPGRSEVFEKYLNAVEALLGGESFR